MAVEVVAIPETEKPLLWARLQDYIRELMPYDGGPIPADGVFRYPYFDAYWQEPEQRWPFWGAVDGRRAAFALVRRGEERFEMAEFYSFPEFRRSGTALAFARAVIRKFPGPWELTEYRAHSASTAFWHRVIADWPFDESLYIGEQSGKERVRQTFTVPRS
jgi:predicted acetyltransferase